jgi:hypothetical protein
MGNPETEATLGYNIIQRQANEKKMKMKINILLIKIIGMLMMLEKYLLESECVFI